MSRFTSHFKFRQRTHLDALHHLYGISGLCLYLLFCQPYRIASLTVVESSSGQSLALCKTGGALANAVKLTVIFPTSRTFFRLGEETWNAFPARTLALNLGNLITPKFVGFTEAARCDKGWLRFEVELSVTLRLLQKNFLDCHIALNEFRDRNVAVPFGKFIGTLERHIVCAATWYGQPTDSIARRCTLYAYSEDAMSAHIAINAAGRLVVSSPGALLRTC